ncbi:MAG: hypothetical protein IJT73_01360, partial [Selenomonadaceae bacterium]|nr:hypothetical protein [Selenomonadaceae bacterium]
VFWCRTAALEKITAYNWQVEDFPEEPMPDDGTVSHALERIFPFAAQAKGFYTGWLMTSNFVKDTLENYTHFYFENRMLPAPVTPVNLKYFIKATVPQKYWFLFYPFKRLLQKLGFNV